MYRIAKYIGVLHNCLRKVGFCFVGHKLFFWVMHIYNILGVIGLKHSYKTSY